MDGWLLVALGLLGGASAAVHPRAACLGGALVAAIMLRSCSRRAWCAALLAFGVGWWRADVALDQYRDVWQKTRAALEEPSRCAGVGRVISSPTVRDDTVRFLLDAGKLECEGRVIEPGAILRLYGGPRDLGRGDKLEVITQLGPRRMFRNFGPSDPRPWAAREGAVLTGSVLSLTRLQPGTGLRRQIDRLRARVRARIAATFAPNAVPMARALVLGENDLSEADNDAFKRSGLAHLLAVSGTHLVFAVLSLVQALRFILVRIEPLAARWDVGRFSAAIGIGLALLYADFSGGTGSAWRAAWMLAVAFAARAAGRRPNGIRAFALSLWVGAILDPLALWDLSFLLSAAATSGLLWAQRWAGRLRAIRFAPFRYLAGSVVATVSAMIPCSPLLAVLSPELTLASVAANVVAAPIGEMAALPLCLAHSTVSFLPQLESGMAIVGSGALLIVRAVAHASAAATWSALPVPAPTAWHWAVLTVGVAGMLVRARQTRRRGWLLALAIAMTGVEVGASRAGHPAGILRVSMTDIGQGDALLIDLPDGKLMLIDGGGFVGSPVDPGVTLRAVLRARRRTRIDIAVLSHPHPDHFLGMSSLLANVEVGELWDTGQGEREGSHPAYHAMLADLRHRHVPIRRPEVLCGNPRNHGGAQIEVLGPCPSFTPGRPENDNSLVLRIAYGRHVALMTGDAETHQEAELIERHGSRLRADLLKVGHHGSRTSSSTAFLNVVQPDIALVSCGVRNRFGHPHPEAMQRLRAAGAMVLTADRTGAVVWRSDGRRIAMGMFEQ